MAQNCEKLRWPIENCMSVIGNVIATHATNLSPPHRRQLMEFLGDSRGRVHPKICVGRFVTKINIEEFICEAIPEDGFHRDSPSFGNMEENQNWGRRETGNIAAAKTENHSDPSKSLCISPQPPFPSVLLRNLQRMKSTLEYQATLGFELPPAPISST